ncbi:MAG: lysoplasmalogenase, partial [Chloroflexi bacterium]|nr:lysoplasmalogenase [Chloroflexota bacterium]
IYALIISIMLYSALTTLLDDQWHYTSALWVSVGALLFCVSDIMNAWVRFVGPITNARVKIMLTYHLAQIALALGAALHFAV